jgi:hypothetical protein
VIHKVFTPATPVNPRTEAFEKTVASRHRLRDNVPGTKIFLGELQ